MSRTATIVGYIAIMAGVANVMLFYLWWGIVNVSADMPAAERGYTVEALSVQITLLEVVLVVAGFGLAGLGVLGYIEIKNIAVAKAVEAASKEAERQFRQWREVQEARFGRGYVPGQTETYGSHPVNQDSLASAERAGGE